MSLPTTASFVLNAIEVPLPLSLSSFLPVFVFLLHSTACLPPPSPEKTFLPVIYRVTNGVPRGLYSRVAVTPLASSPWPAHAIYLSRLRDSIRLSFSPDRSSSFLLTSFRSIATSAPLHHSRRPSLDRHSRSMSLPGIFSLRARGPNLLSRKRFQSIYGEHPRFRSIGCFCPSLSRLPN